MIRNGCFVNLFCSEPIRRSESPQNARNVAPLANVGSMDKRLCLARTVLGATASAQMPIDLTVFFTAPETLIWLLKL